MKPLLRHQQICDELHELSLEERRFLQNHRRSPQGAFLERKRTLLASLDESLAALRTTPREGVSNSTLKQAVEKAKSRILQLLQITRENEELMLRHSLSHCRQDAAASAAAAPAFLPKVYRQKV